MFSICFLFFGFPFLCLFFYFLQPDPPPATHYPSPATHHPSTRYPPPVTRHPQKSPADSLLTQIKRGRIAVSSFIGTLHVHMNWWTQTTWI